MVFRFVDARKKINNLLKENFSVQRVIAACQLNRFDKMRFLLFHFDTDSKSS